MIMCVACKQFGSADWRLLYTDWQTRKVYFYVYKVVISVCLIVRMFDHNSWTRLDRFVSNSFPIPFSAQSFPYPSPFSSPFPPLPFPSRFIFPFPFFSPSSLFLFPFPPLTLLIFSLSLLFPFPFSSRFLLFPSPLFHPPFRPCTSLFPFLFLPLPTCDTKNQKYFWNIEKITTKTIFLKNWLEIAYYVFFQNFIKIY